MRLEEFFFGVDGAVLLGAEHLSAGGMCPEFAQALREATGLDRDWTDGVDRAVRLFHERVAALHERSAEYWFAPRLANLVVIRDPERVRPHTSIFPDASWLVYEDDFRADPHGELGAFMLIHQERLAQERRLGATVVKNLSYWLLRTEEEREIFAEAAARSVRPDRHAFVALAAAFAWLDELGHKGLASIEPVAGESYGLIESAGMIVPASRKPELARLLDTFRETDAKVGTAHFSHHTRGASEEQTASLCSWLREAAPSLLLTTEDGQILWDPARPESTAALRSVLGKLAAGPANSLREDWKVVGERTDQLFAALRDPQQLDAAIPDLEQEEGGTYIHGERKRMAYCVVQPGFDCQREPAPPFHRLLLAARTLHEWGHLIEEVGLVVVPQEGFDAFMMARAGVVACVESILTAPDALVRSLAEREAESMGLAVYEERAFAELLTGQLFERMPDFLANLVVQRFANSAEMEAYVRINVQSLANEPGGPFSQLMRHAYAYQYLRFSRIEDGLSYFMRVTGIEAEFVRPGILTLEQLHALLGAVAAVCDAYVIDDEGVGRVDAST